MTPYTYISNYAPSAVTMDFKAINTQVYEIQENSDSYLYSTANLPTLAFLKVSPW